ncbi:hypothetical protein V8E55_010370 [Tylopilus felleus]
MYMWCMWSIIGARQGGDVVINILSKAEKSYIQSSLLSDPPLRLDSRSLEDYRPISLKTGVVPLANGSAKICIGRPGRGHRVRPGGRRRRRRDGSGHLELAAVREEEEGGKVTVGRLVAPPQRTLRFSSNALDDLQSDLTILLESVLSHPSLQPDNLVIVPRTGKKAWAVKLDAVVFADGGNIVDCQVMLTCRAALWDTKVPRTKAACRTSRCRDADGATEEKGGLETKDTRDATDFELTDCWDEGEVLSGRDSWLVCVTLNVLSKVHFLDATLQEEASVPLRMHVMYAFPRGQPILQTFRLVGLKVSTKDQIRDLIKRAETYARNAWTGLEAKLKDEETRRGVKAREKFYGRLR